MANNPLCPYCGYEMQLDCSAATHAFPRDYWFYCPECYSQSPKVTHREFVISAAMMRPTDKEE